MIIWKPYFFDEESGETVEVAIEYSPGYYIPAKLYGHPDSWAPEEGENPEILAVRIQKTGKDILSRLSREKLDCLMAECWMHQQNMADAEASNRSDDYGDWDD